MDSIIWAQGQGQLPQSGAVPMTGVLPQPPGRFAVKFDVDEKDRELFSPRAPRATRRSTPSASTAIHILRKVIIRVGAYHQLPDPEAALIRSTSCSSEVLLSAIAAATTGCAFNPPPTTGGLQQQALGGGFDVSASSASR